MGSAARWKTIMIYSEQDQKILDNVDEYGCHVSLVFDDKEEKPDFAFSTGFLKTFNQPDVIIYGLRRDLMHNMINEISNQCKEGLVLRENLKIENLLEGFACITKRVHPSHFDEHFGTAIWYYHEIKREFIDVYQIFWPGAQSGQFPWEDDCDPAIIEMQPLLYKAKV